MIIIINNIKSDVLFCTFTVQRSHITEWDIAETQGKGPFPEILEYDIFVNCILLNEVLVIKHVNSRQSAKKGFMGKSLD